MECESDEVQEIESKSESETESEIESEIEAEIESESESEIESKSESETESEIESEIEAEIEEEKEENGEERSIESGVAERLRSLFERAIDGTQQTDADLEPAFRVFLCELPERTRTLSEEFRSGLFVLSDLLHFCTLIRLEVYDTF